MERADESAEKPNEANTEKENTVEKESQMDIDTITPEKQKASDVDVVGNASADEEEEEEDEDNEQGTEHNQGPSAASSKDDENFSEKLSYVLRNYLEKVSGTNIAHFSDYERYLQGIGKGGLAEDKLTNHDLEVDNRLKWRTEPMPSPAAGVLGKAVGGPVSVWRRAKDTFPEKLLSRCALIQYNRILDWLNFLTTQRLHTTGLDEFYRKRKPVVAIDPVPLLYIAETAAKYALEIIKVAAHMVKSDLESNSEEHLDSNAKENVEGKSKDKEHNADTVENKDNNGEKSAGDGNVNEEDKIEDSNKQKEVEVETNADNCERFDVERSIDSEDIQAAVELVAKRMGRRPTADNIYGARSFHDPCEGQIRSNMDWPELKVRPMTDEESVMLCNRMPTSIVTFPTDVVLEMKAILCSYRSFARRWVYNGEKEFKVKDPTIFMTNDEKREEREKRFDQKAWYDIKRQGQENKSQTAEKNGENAPSEGEGAVEGSDNVNSAQGNDHSGEEENMVVLEDDEDIRPIEYSVNKDLSQPRTEIENSTGMEELTPDDRIMQPRYSSTQKLRRGDCAEPKFVEDGLSVSVQNSVNIAELIAFRRGFYEKKKKKDTEKEDGEWEKNNQMELKEFLDRTRFDPAFKGCNTICLHRLVWICLHALGHDVESENEGGGMVGYGQTVDYTRFGELGIAGGVTMKRSAIFALSEFVDVFVRDKAEILMDCAAHDNGRPWIDRADVALMTSMRKEQFGYHGL